MQPFRLGHFIISEELGRGTTGIIYKAFDESLNREVAIKMLHTHHLRNPLKVREFLEEARTAATINHPHVVQIYFVGSDQSQPYVVMELVRGKTLEHILAQQGKLPEPIAITIALEAARGLQAAANVGLLHRDIKPRKIFIDDQHGVKILDFRGSSDGASLNVAMDASAYIPPERLHGESEDCRSDLYSLGATIYHLITGCPPTHPNLLSRYRAGGSPVKPQPVNQLVPGIHKKTTELISKMLEPDVLNRYRDYNQVIHDLFEAQAEIVQSPRIPETNLPEVKSKPVSKRAVEKTRKGKPAGNRNRKMLLVSSILVLTGLAAFMFLKQGDHIDPATGKWPFVSGGGKSQLLTFNNLNGFVHYATINFQPASAIEANEFMADRGEVYGKRRNGMFYGWDKPCDSRGRQAKTSPDVKYNTVVFAQTRGNAATWEMQVPNGTYAIRIVSGDSDYPQESQFTLEGFTVQNQPTTREEPWVDTTNAVSISDGKITIAPVQAPYAFTKIAFIEVWKHDGITSLSTRPSSPQPAPPVVMTGRPSDFTPWLKINFQADSESPVEGYLVDTGMVFQSWPNGYRYGWKTERERRERPPGIGPDSRYNTFVFAQMNGIADVWELEVPNGEYLVKLVAGDPSNVDLQQFKLEGVLCIDRQTTTEELWVEATQMVKVSDGKLTLTPVQRPNGFSKICFLEIARK